MGYIADGNGEHSSIVVKEKDVVGNRKEEGAVFVKIRDGCETNASDPASEA